MAPPISLRKVAETDAPDLFVLWSDFETVKFTNWTLIATNEECSKRVSRMIERYHPDSGRLGPYVIRARDSDFVGLIGVDVVNAEHELWYLLRRDRWGQGLGTQALAELIKIVSAASHVKHAVATAVAGNIASWRLLERNGFVRVNTSLGGFERHGLKMDLFTYARTFHK